MGTSSQKFNCPYCNKELPSPSRKRNCPHCKNMVYARSRPGVEKVWVKEENLKTIEKEWKNYRAAAEFKRGLKSSNLGFTEKKYLKTKEGLTRKFGFIPSESNTLWGVSNFLSEEAIRMKDWHKMKMLYFNMALFLHQESKDCFKILQEVARCELKNEQKSGVVERVEILTAGDQSCSACQELAGKILTIEEALRDMPIPVKICSFKLNPEAPSGWCRCCYVPVIE